MSNKVNKKKKKKMSQSAIVLIISLVIIAIPVIVFLSILLNASLNNNTPQNGDRYKYDLNPAITDSVTRSIESSVKSLSNVENCEITLKTSQLRINVDTSDAISKEEALELVNAVYGIVENELPIETYFTISSSGQKMYDLSINVYNFVDNSGGNMIYYCLTKNSKMEDYEIQLLSEPVDEELAEELRNPEGSNQENEDGEN